VNKPWNSKVGRLAIAGVVAAGAVVGIAVAANGAVKPDCKTLSYPLCARSVAAAQVVDNSLPGNTKLAPKSVDESRLSAGVVTKLNKVGTPSTGLANWGEIFRNTEGNARAELGQSSQGEGLNFSVPTGTDKVDFGNEADFAGKAVNLTSVKYEVFTTGENSALGPNMPSIKFEMNPKAQGKTYTTLVYAPGNSTPNAWDSIDAKADTGKHWGFTGFANDHCGINGPRCTLTEALAELGDGATFISAGVGKGKDYAFHGAVKSLTINGTKYSFTAHGVEK
jgi:hypothetical protein